MTNAIEVPGADFFTGKIGTRRLPDTDGLVAEYLLGGSLAASRANLADPDAANLTEIGEPTYGTGYVAIRSNGNELFPSYGLQTDFTTPPLFTAIAVVQRDSSTAWPDWFYQDGDASGGGIGAFGGLRANRNNPDGEGNRYYFMGSNSQGANGGRIEYPATSVSAFIMVAMTGAVGARGNNYLWSAGVRTSVRNEVFGNLRSTNAWQIGGRSSLSPNNGDGKVAYCAAYDRILTAAELDAAYTSLKAALALRSVTVS